MANYPRVWDGAAYSRRLHPLFCSVSQSLDPLSTASIDVPSFDDVAAFDWVAIETPDGKQEYYRVMSVETDTATGEKSIYLEHGACTLGDIIIPDTSAEIQPTETSSNGANTRSYTEDLNDTITNIVTHILEKQQDGRWAVGTIDATDTIYIELGGHSLLDALTTMMQYIPDYQLEFEQRTETEWYVNIKLRPTVPICEGRLSRNLTSCTVSYDAQNIVTRVYCDGIPGGYMDSANTALYGVKSIVQPLSDNISASQKSAITAAFLRNHDHPTVSVSISAVELSGITGLAIDKFTVGSVCRIAIPWLEITVDEVVIDKRYRDIFNKPEEVMITLANATPDLVIAMAALTSNSGSGGGGGGGGGGAGKQKEAEKQKKRFETHFEKTDTYFRLLATDTQWDEMGHGTITAYSQIVQTASSIQSVVADIASSGYSSITQLANSIGLRVGTAEEAISQIQIDLNGIYISGKEIVISGNTIDLNGYVTVTDFDALNARIDNLTTGQTAASRLWATTLVCGDFYKNGTAASWESKTVVTSVTWTAPALGMSTAYDFKTSGGNNIHGRLVTSWSDGDVSASRSTIYYLGHS